MLTKNWQMTVSATRLSCLSQNQMWRNSTSLHEQLSRLPPFKFYRLFTARCKHIFHIYVHCFRLNISWMFCMNRSFNRTNGHIQKPKALNVGFNFIHYEKKCTLPSFQILFQTHYFISPYRSSYQKTKKNKTGFIYTNDKIKPQHI